MTTTLDDAHARTEQVLPTRSWAFSPLVLSAATFFIVLVVASWPIISDPTVEGGDAAADSLRVPTFWSQTDGIYSRWGFHHPGPLLFWLYGLSERLLANGLVGLPPLGAHVILVIGIATASTALLVAALENERNRLLLGPAVFLFAAVSSIDGTAVVPWAPSLGNWFFVMAAAGLTAVSRDRSWGYPVTVVAAFALVHLHVLFVPLGLLGLVWVSVRLARRPPSRKWLWICTALALTLAAPMVAAAVNGTSPWPKYLRLLSSGDAQLSQAITSPASAVVATLAPGVACLLIAGLLFAVPPRGRVPRLPSLVAVTGLVYLVSLSGLSFLTRYSFGSTILMIAAAALVSSVTAPAGARTAITGASSLVLAAVILGFVVNTDVPMRSPQAETAVHDFDKFRETHPRALLRVDNAVEPYTSYWNAPALVLLAERSGFAYCVVRDRWPHWMERTQMCEGTAGRPTFTVRFTGMTKYTVTTSVTR